MAFFFCCCWYRTREFQPAKDAKKFNLGDPVEKNTVGVPAGGWTAIRFRADNPGEDVN